MHRTIAGALALLFTLFSTSVSFAESDTAAKAITPDEVEGPLDWGDTTNVTKLRHLYFAGQPDEAGLKAAHDAGVRVVINLRAPKEMDWDEAAAAKALGMKYENVPVDGRNFTPAAIERVEALLKENKGVPTLVHCSSSNRAGGWLATHMVTQHQSAIEDALAIGRKTGITKGFVETAVRNYLDARSNSQPNARTDGGTK